jgi:hypothetical protein
MKKVIVICALFVSSSAFFASCGSSEAKVAYQCPMKCEGAAVTYDKPGECPMCGMTLEEVK